MKDIELSYPLRVSISYQKYTNKNDIDWGNVNYHNEIVKLGHFISLIGERILLL